jgi:type IV pilus assembly protein PilE
MNPHCNTRKHRSEGRIRGSAGFSLIELMVVVAIASILVAVAVPSYLYEVRKGRRTDAKTALLDMAAREERYFSTNNGVYTTTAANLGYSGTFPVTVNNGDYTIATPTVTAGSTTAVATFSITATPVTGNDQAKDTTCASFTVTSAGAQTSQNSSGTDTTSTCWH